MVPRERVSRCVAKSSIIDEIFKNIMVQIATNAVIIEQQQCRFEQQKRGHQTPQYLLQHTNSFPLKIDLRTPIRLHTLKIMEAKKRKKSLSFEVAMEKLDGIVKTLENGNIPLGKLVETYREGLMYQKICQEHLDRATLTLETLKAEGFDSDESCSA